VRIGSKVLAEVAVVCDNEFAIGSSTVRSSESARVPGGWGLPLFSETSMFRVFETEFGSRATSKQPISAAKASEEKDDNGGGADVTLKNPKKRKINIFPTGNDGIQFTFGGMSNVCFFSYFSLLVFLTHMRMFE
jgi:hypothetical protein